MAKLDKKAYQELAHQNRAWIDAMIQMAVHSYQFINQVGAFKDVDVQKMVKEMFDMDKLTNKERKEIERMLKPIKTLRDLQSKPGVFRPVEDKHYKNLTDGDWDGWRSKDSLASMDRITRMIYAYHLDEINRRIKHYTDIDNAIERTATVKRPGLGAPWLLNELEIYINAVSRIDAPSTLMTISCWTRERNVKSRKQQHYIYLANTIEEAKQKAWITDAYTRMTGTFVNVLTSAYVLANSSYPYGIAIVPTRDSRGNFMYDHAGNMLFDLVVENNEGSVSKNRNIRRR